MQFGHISSWVYWRSDNCTHMQCVQPPMRLAAYLSRLHMCPRQHFIAFQFHHRDPHLVGLLASDAIPPGRTVYYGMIADGIHTHPAALRIAHRTHPKGICSSFFISCISSRGYRNDPVCLYSCVCLYVSALTAEPFMIIIFGKRIDLDDILDDFDGQVQLGQRSRSPKKMSFPGFLIWVYRYQTLAYGVTSWDVMVWHHDIIWPHCMTSRRHLTSQNDVTTVSGRCSNICIYGSQVDMLQSGENNDDYLILGTHTALFTIFHSVFSWRMSNLFIFLI